MTITEKKSCDIIPNMTEEKIIYSNPSEAKVAFANQHSTTLMSPETKKNLDVGRNKKGTPDIAQHRARLGKEFMSRMRADFQKHGIATIERVRKEKPAAYLELVARMVPMAMEVNINHTFMDLLKEAQERYTSQAYPSGNVFEAEVVRED